MDLSKHKVKRAVILGSGVRVRESTKPDFSLSYSEIPGWPLGKVAGHKGVLDIYSDLWVLRGRAHLYEGFTWQQACFPTQFLIDHGIEDLYLTNAAGGINPDFAIGDLMQITGYLNFLKPGLARGNLGSLGQVIKEVPGIQINSADLQYGTYIGVHGPNYETDSEVALFRSLGADAVGMSTVPELETAIHQGINVTALSIITNVYGKTEELGHEGVLGVAKQSSKKLVSLLNLD